MQESLERDQALQQWLRRVPDDPSGLLREKFRYESRQRQQQGETRNRDQIW
jgi:Ca-activated chloride channel family protein